MIKTIPDPITSRYGNRVLGVIKDLDKHRFYLITAQRVDDNIPHYNLEESKIKQMALRCENCLKPARAVDLQKYRYLYIINEDGMYINEQSVKLDKEFIFLPHLCEKCEYNKLITTCAAIYCDVCKQRIKWAEPQTLPNGFRIHVGHHYYVKVCGTCNPEISEMELIERDYGTSFKED